MQQTNICFHGIGTPNRELEPGEDKYWITSEQFEEIVDYLAKKPSVQLSFDDGNASDAEIALPALARRGLRATFFPVAARIGRTGSIDRDGLRDLARRGMQIGSHGMHHQSWRRLTDAELDEELVLARRLIAEESGVTVDTAACPLGEYDRRVLTRLRHLGYSRVFTSDRCAARPGSWLQPRYSVTEDDSPETVRATVEQHSPATTTAISYGKRFVKRWR
ncbi:MAG TPA: polysaccharide deacetylase family protein [Jatrophihabitantaceae bacterium]|jgi:peptidoglycan/xylan/chitin deacetylase (PgdA/CDA1 family)